MKRLYGVTTAMVTPFDKDGNVDLGRVKHLTEFLIDKGVHGLYPLGTTGEMFRLTLEERKAVAETVVKTANQRVRVFIHTGAMRLEETIELSKHAYHIEADGIGVVTPVYFKVNEREMEEYYITVATSIPESFPMYLYNIPQCSANDLSSEVAQKVADRCQNVVGIKYSYPDLIRTSEYLQINNGQFSVMHGTDRLLLNFLAIGCDGTVSGVSSVYPEPFVAIYHAFQENDLEKARKWQTIAAQYCEILRRGSNMSYFKEALKIRGIDAGYIRPPQQDLTPEEVETLQNELREIDRKACLL